MTTEAGGETWYTVRCIFGSEQWVDPDDGPQGPSYEERITIWRATSFETAIELAEDDAREYANTVGVEYLDLAQAFMMSDAPNHGVEIFSLIRDSDLDAEAYLERFFSTGTERQGNI